MAWPTRRRLKSDPPHVYIDANLLIRGSGGHDLVPEVFDRMRGINARFVSSDVLRLEVALGPHVQTARAKRLRAMLALAKTTVHVNKDIMERAIRLRERPEQLGNLDAMHLAFAEWADVDYLITLEGRAKPMHRATFRERLYVVTPIGFLTRTT